MRFVNRVSDHPNRKTLTVQEVNYHPNTGEINTLVVDVANNEGIPNVEGPKLNAQNLNSIIDDLSGSALAHLFFKSLYGLIVPEENFNIEIIGNNPVSISYSFENGIIHYPYNLYNENFDITFSNNTITITRTNLINPDSGIIYIEFYSTPDLIFRAFVLPIRYQFYPSSTNPLD